MKSIFFAVLLCLTFIRNAISQIPFYDALDLNHRIVSNRIIVDNDSANLKILAQYLSIQNPNATAIVNEFSDNPFFTVPGLQMATGATFASGAGFLKSIGGLNVTNFADGLAKFMVKRFKEELNLAFFQKFKKDLDNPVYKELKILFPETDRLLQAIGIEIYRYNVYIMTLREAFIKDLTNLYPHFDNLFKLPKYKILLDTRPILKTLFTTSQYLINKLSRGIHAGQILAGFPVNELNFNNDTLTKNISGAIETMKLFSASLRSKSAERYWIDADSLSLLFKDDTLIEFKVYMGLLYQQSKKLPVRFNGSHSLQAILAQVTPQADTLGRFKMFIENFVDKTEEVHEYITELKDKKKSEIDYNDYQKFFNASLDIIQHSFEFVELPFINSLISAQQKSNIFEKAGYWLFVARTSGEVYVDTRTKNYSSAILNVSILLDTLVRDSSSAVKEKILKYGTFMATIAAAENSDDVATAIEAVALPVGGSGIKKHSTFNIALQSYLGGSYGRENIKELKNNQSKSVASVFGPVGFSFSWSVLQKWKNPGSVSIVANVIDLGAIASFRFNDDSTSINSKIELKNIFAPGVYLVFGIPKFPISIGYGFQTGPQLREIKSGVPTFETKKIYTRSSLFLGVDIPLFNLYNRAK